MSIRGTRSPSIDPMLMTLAGSSGVAAARSCGQQEPGHVKDALHVDDRARSQAASSKSSIGTAQVAPALLTRMSSFSSRFVDLGGQRTATFLGREVRLERDALTDLGELRRGLLAGRVLAGRDVDLGPRLDEARRDHLADAP